MKLYFLIIILIFGCTNINESNEIKNIKLDDKTTFIKRLIWKVKYWFKWFTAKKRPENFPASSLYRFKYLEPKSLYRGFPEEEDWILYGPYSDKSLIRNKLTFDLSNSIGYSASRTKFYNLFINNENKGLYVLMEKIKRDKNRVDISKLEDDSIEGGYIIKIDKPTGDGESCSTCYDDSFSFSSRYDTNGGISDQSNIFFIYCNFIFNIF